ncbi:hypothetical protein ACLMJK_003880 [Lecanora helva]
MAPLSNSDQKHVDDEWLSKVESTCQQAIKYAFSQAKEDGHWCGEQLGNATMASEYVFLRQSLGLDLKRDKEALNRWLFLDQKPDGSWGLAPNYPGDVSTSVEAYLALKILGVAPDTAQMEKARKFILAVGGVAQIRVFTRFYIAAFGLLPWAAVPEMPPELVIMPSWAPINIYRLSSWARAIVVPLTLLSHHQPIFTLPNGKHSNNDFLDELWLDPTSKAAPYSKPLRDLFWTDRVSASFAVIDSALSYLGGLRSFVSRGYARRQTVKWILDHQEADGHWGGGIFPAAHFGILALLLEGFSIKDSPIVKNLEAIESLTINDKGGKRIQPCMGPVWDTILMSISLIDCNIDPNDKSLCQSIDWVRRRQLFGPEGDWRVYNPQRLNGSFSFEYVNTWYPDVDDTAAAIQMFVKQDPRSASSHSVTAALDWIFSMQNRDGGWGAFDTNNNALFLNKIPFSDMGALCDPSSADLAGRVLEAYGLITQASTHVHVDPTLLRSIATSSSRAIAYLTATQESSGAWYGRWGCNYIYGTSNVLCGLVYHTGTSPNVQNLINPAIAWLKKMQNADGGWGEGLDTYTHPERAGCGPSTPTQTAWALMALLAHLERDDEVIRRGMGYLVEGLRGFGEEEEGKGGTWVQREYVGTGFPGHWYLGYTFYKHYFPMMALGRYLQKKGAFGKREENGAAL